MKKVHLHYTVLHYTTLRTDFPFITLQIKAEAKKHSDVFGGGDGYDDRFDDYNASKSLCRCSYSDVHMHLISCCILPYRTIRYDTIRCDATSYNTAPCRNRKHFRSRSVILSLKIILCLFYIAYTSPLHSNHSLSDPNHLSLPYNLFFIHSGGRLHVNTPWSSNRTFHSRVPGPRTRIEITEPRNTLSTYL